MFHGVMDVISRCVTVSGTVGQQLSNRAGAKANANACCQCWLAAQLAQLAPLPLVSQSDSESVQV